MPRLAQYDYLMAIGTMFSLLDAYNIGGGSRRKILDAFRGYGTD